MSTHTPSARRRGGQPGNTNALKHGLSKRKYHTVPAHHSLAEKKVETTLPILTYEEETELLRQFFLRVLRLYPDQNDFITNFSVFRKVVDIVRLQAVGVRALHPLTAADYEQLANNLEQLLRIILAK